MRHGFAGDGAGLHYPDSEDSKAPQAGWLQLDYWGEGEQQCLLTEFDYLLELKCHLQRQGEAPLAAELIDPEQLRPELLLLDLSGLLYVKTLHRYLAQKLALLPESQGGWQQFEQSICSDGASLMPRMLLVEGLECLEQFQPGAHHALIEVLTRYRTRFPERTLILRGGSPSGAGFTFQERI